MSKPKLKTQNLLFSLRKITKLVALLALRESYLFSKNVYGMVEHPKLTMGRIVKQRDLSQGLLIFGLPAGLWLGWIFVLLVSRIFIFGRLRFGFLAKVSFLASTLFTSFCILLFSFCLCVVWKKGRRGSE